MVASPDRTGAGSAHLPALDGVRGIAIILVLAYHLFLWPVLNGQVQPSHAIDKGVNQVLNAGWTGVDLFFVLSGFLITRILLAARSGPNYFRSFYLRRALRIFPLYFGFLLILIVVIPALPAFASNPGLDSLVEHQLAYWTYMVNVAISLDPLGYFFGPYSNSHFWSLAVEEQFYLVWPAVVLLLGRRLAVFCVFCIFAAPLFRLALLNGAFPNFNESLAAHMLMPARMDALAVGGLVAVWAMSPTTLDRARSWALPTGLAAAAVCVGLAVTQGSFHWQSEEIQVIGYSAIAMAFGAFLLALVGNDAGTIQSLTRHRVLTFFGAYSYGLYVLHYQLTQSVYSQLEERGGLFDVGGSYLPAQLVVGSGLLVSTLAAAWLSWHLFESQFLKFKRFVPYGQPRDAQSVMAVPPGLVPEQP